MKQRRRIYYSAAQRSEIYDRWQAGELMSSIGRRLTGVLSVFSVISPTGGIRPKDRRRSRQTLSLIARHLGRSPSTISREIQRNGGADCYRTARSEEAA